MLCRKTVDLFTLLSRREDSEKGRTGMTQELLALVTGLAHYLKILIRIALTGGLKLEREQNIHDPTRLVLEKLSLLTQRGGNPLARRLIKDSQDTSITVSNADGLAISDRTDFTGTRGVAYGYQSLSPENAGDSPFWVSGPERDMFASSSTLGDNHASGKLSSGSPPSDLCMACNITVEEDCVRLGTYQRWHSSCIQCMTCGKQAAQVVVKEPPKASSSEGKEKDDGKEKESQPKVSSSRRPPANVREFVYDESQGEKRTILIYCVEHGHSGCKDGFQAVSRLEQYAFLLNVALRRLYVLLKTRGVIQLMGE